MRTQRPSINMSYALISNRRNRVTPIIEVDLTPNNSPQSTTVTDTMSLHIVRAIAEGAYRAQYLWNEVVNRSLQTAADEVRHDKVTQEKLDSVAPTVRFSKKLNVSHDKCPVCLSEFKRNKQVKTLQCGHSFCRSCISKWACEVHSCCPVCRSDIC